MAWKLDEQRDASAVAVLDGRILPPDLVQALRNPDVQGHAWNAAFETAVLERLGVFVANPLILHHATGIGLRAARRSWRRRRRRWGCAHQKDMAGHRLMLRMSRPLKPGAAAVDARGLRRRWRTTAPRTSRPKRQLAAVIPELQPEEAELSAARRRMNMSGELGIDLHRVATLPRSWPRPRRRRTRRAARC